MQALLLKQTATEIAELPLDSEWDSLPDCKREKATKWAPLVRSLVEKAIYEGASISYIVDWFLAVWGSSKAAHIQALAKGLGRGGKAPSRACLIGKCTAYKKHGLMGLVPKHKGSERKEFGWEVRALHFWQKPSKPSYQAVAEWLQDEGHETANYHRVRAYLKALPADLQMRGRMGAKLFADTQKTFIRRTTEDLLPGQVYQGDGNTLDIYLQHPTGQRVWRAELTLWLDVASRKVVGWYISEAESANSTLFALSHALLTQNHIPAMLHIDNGSGYKNKMMSDSSTGLYQRLGIDIMHSRPYNGKGKGHVERFFGTMQRKFLKRFDSYCGDDMDSEALQKVLKDFNAGKRSLPTRAEFVEAFTEWLERYHETPHGGLNKRTPNEVFEALEHCALDDTSTAIFWPRASRTVRRSCVHFEGREYGCPELLHYNKQQVTIEYSLHDDAYVRVLDAKGRWICDATLIQKQAYMPASRIEEAKQKRALAQTKRLANKQKEIELRERIAVTHDQTLDDPTLGFEDKAAEVEEQPGTTLAPMPARPSSIGNSQQPSNVERDIEDLF